MFWPCVKRLRPQHDCIAKWKVEMVSCHLQKVWQEVFFFFNRRETNSCVNDTDIANCKLQYWQTHPCSSLTETEILRLCPSTWRAVRISAHCTISPSGPPFSTLGLNTSPDSSVRKPTWIRTWEREERKERKKWRELLQNHSSGCDVIRSVL